MTEPRQIQRAQIPFAVPWLSGETYFSIARGAATVTSTNAMPSMSRDAIRARELPAAAPMALPNTMTPQPSSRTRFGPIFFASDPAEMERKIPTAVNTDMSQEPVEDDIP